MLRQSDVLGAVWLVFHCRKNVLNCQASVKAGVYSMHDAGGFYAVADVNHVKGYVNKFIPFFCQSFGAYADNHGVCFDKLFAVCIFYISAFVGDFHTGSIYHSRNIFLLYHFQIGNPLGELCFWPIKWPISTMVLSWPS